MRLLFYFQGVVSKLHLQFGYPRRRKYMGCPEGGNPLGSGSSNRGEQHPVGIGDPKVNNVSLGRGIQRGQRTPWHTIFRQESLVCYTFVERMAAGNVTRP